MKITITAKEPLDAEGRAYLKNAEKLLNHTMQNITPEESFRRIMLYGSIITRTDEDGIEQYVDPQDMLITLEKDSAKK